MRLVILERPMAKKICSEAVVVLLDNLRINFGEPGFLTFSQASLARRLEAARGELEYGRAEGNFDLRVVNDQVGLLFMFNHQLMFLHLLAGGEGLRAVEGVHAAHFGQVEGGGN